MSRPTVSEALRSLEAMNILESRYGAGTFVSSLGAEELLRPLQFALARGLRPSALVRGTGKGAATAVEIMGFTGRVIRWPPAPPSSVA